LQADNIGRNFGAGRKSNFFHAILHCCNAT
jgi:hypothetical protein